MSTWELPRTVLAEIRRKLSAGGWRLPALGAVPALVAVGIQYWFAEIYVAAMGFGATQALTLALAGLCTLGLMAISVGRMTHFLLRPARRPRLHFALEVRSPEARSVLAFGLFLGLFCLFAGITAVLHGLASSAFFVAGSEGIERLVSGLAQAALAVGGFYLLARVSPLVSAAAIGAPGLGAIWSATDEDAGLLLILIWVLPALVFCLLAGPSLWSIGALPFPSATDLVAGELLVSRLHSVTGFLAMAGLWAAHLTAWCLMAIGLSLAHERLLPDAYAQAAQLAAKPSAE